MSKAARIREIANALRELGDMAAADEYRRSLAAADLRRAVEKIDAGIRELGEYVNIARICDADSDNPGLADSSIKETESVIQWLKIARTWVVVAAKEIVK